MKTIVYDFDFDEPEIKPQAAVDEYRRLLAAEVTATLAAGALHQRSCPGCAGGGSRHAFVKFGLAYVECLQCGSLYVSPCPDEAALDAFYRQSSADRFWREEVFAQTRDARLRKMYRPQAEWAVDTIARYRPEARTAVDVGFQSELFIESVFAEASTLVEIVLAGRSNSAAGAHPPRLSVQPGYLALRPRQCTDVVFALDVLPRAADTEGLLGSIHDALVPGGLALFTTVSASGFDVRALWDRAPNLYPPDRINLLSVEGLTAAFARAGFELLEFSTPGAFDVHAVRRAIDAEPEATSDRFIHHFVRHSSSETLHRFQDFLQEHRLSSFARLVARRPVIAGEGHPNAHS